MEREINKKDKIYTEIVKYELSGDKKGLIAILDSGLMYHVRSDELSALEKWIHSLLKKGGNI